MSTRARPAAPRSSRNASRPAKATPAGGAERDARAAQLARLGLRRDWDFALHLPLRYEDETRVVPIAELQPGADAQVAGRIMRSGVQARGRRQLVATLQDAAGDTLTLRFLTFYPSTQRLLEPGRQVRAFGAARGGLLGTEMVHPRVHDAGSGVALPDRLTPVYPSAAGISQAWLRERIARALRVLDVSDTVPPALLPPLQLPSLAAALAHLHRPPKGADVASWSERDGPFWRRIAFDEAVAQQLSLRLARRERARLAAPALHGPKHAGLVRALQEALPFRLTGAQQRVWTEVARDLAGGVPMHRLVQGDVGSGKTVIAALAAARAIEAGFQVALMAPTEILAEQHFRRIADWLAPLGVEVRWLAGKLKARDKRAVQAAVRDGAPRLVVGTHALVQQAVDLANLGLAIIDEQHRFGVAQRLALRSTRTDAGRQPHLLMLSATPIPRTLAMSYFADLDVSVIDELPPGRSPVVTKLVAARRRDDVLARVRDEVARGRQAYWVCPLVQEGEDESTAELTAATQMFEHTRAVLPELRLGLLHGQLPAAEKSAVMQAFAAGAIDVLVATTVIEVGVDVANATLMVIEHAQRFGLAQLHQLRGRVGRGAQQSFCVLLYDEPLSANGRARLRAVYETTDGFEIARRDLALRGPGEFLGSRQSGVPLLRFVDLQRDADLVEHASRVAEAMLRNHPGPARRHVERWLGGRQDFLDA